MGTEKPGDLTTRVLVEIRDELKGHRSEFVEIRDELKGHRAEFVEIRDELKGHRAEFVEIRDELKSQRVEHGAQLADIRAELRGQGATLNQMLLAMEHGNAQRDERVSDLETRVTRLEDRIGIQP